MKKPKESTYTRQVFVEVSPEFLAALPSTVKVPVSNGWLTREAALLVSLGMLDKDAWENAMKGKADSAKTAKPETAAKTAASAPEREEKEEKAAFRVVAPDFDEDEENEGQDSAE